MNLPRRQYFVLIYFVATLFVYSQYVLLRHFSALQFDRPRGLDVDIIEEEHVGHVPERQPKDHTRLDESARLVTDLTDLVQLLPNASIPNSTSDFRWNEKQLVTDAVVVPMYYAKKPKKIPNFLWTGNKSDDIHPKEDKFHGAIIIHKPEWGVQKDKHPAHKRHHSGTQDGLEVSDSGNSSSSKPQTDQQLIAQKVGSLRDRVTRQNQIYTKAIDSRLTVNKSVTHLPRQAGQQSVLTKQLIDGLVTAAKNSREHIESQRLNYSKQDMDEYESPGGAMFMTQANYLDRSVVGRHPPYNASDIAHLPKTHPRYEFDTCAMVGNGGALLKTQLGSNIDMHSMVLRLNQAPTKGFHKFVGSRTTFRLLNKKWVHYYNNASNQAANIEDHPINATLLTTRSSPRASQKLAETLSALRPDIQVLLVAAHVVSQSQQLLSTFRAQAGDLGMKHKGGSSPSSGLVAIYLLLRMCSKVTAYGMAQSMERSNGYDIIHAWPALDRKPCNSKKGQLHNARNKAPLYHYFGNSQAVEDTTMPWPDPHHSFTAETDFLKALGIAMPHKFAVCPATSVVVL